MSQYSFPVISGIHNNFCFNVKSYNLLKTSKIPITVSVRGNSVEIAVQIQQLKWQGCVHLLLKSCKHREQHLPQNATWFMAIISSLVWGWSLSIHSHTIVTGTGPLPDPENLLLSTLRKELSEKTHVLTKQKISLGRRAQAESSRVREPRRTALPRGSQSLVLWWWD